MNVNITQQVIFQRNIRDSLISEEADQGLSLRVALMKAVFLHFNSSFKEPVISQAVAKIWTILQSDDYNQNELNQIFDAIFKCKETEERNAVTLKISEKLDAENEAFVDLVKRYEIVAEEFEELRRTNAPALKQLEKYQEFEKLAEQVEKLADVQLTAKKIAALQIEENVALIKNSVSKLNTSLKLIAFIGKKSLNTPLFELLGENPPPDSTPEKRVLQAIKVYQSAYKFYFDYLNSKNKEILEHTEQHQFKNKNNEELIDDFIKVNNEGRLLNDNLRKNLIIIENSITPNLVDMPFSSKIDPILIDDFTYLRLKNLNTTHSKLKENLSNVITDFARRILNKSLDFYNKYNIDTKKVDDPIERLKQFKDPIYLQSIDAKLKSLFDEYRILRGNKSDAEMHLEITEALLGDDIRNEEKKYQTISLKSNKNKPDTHPAPISSTPIKKKIKIIPPTFEVSSEKELLSKNFQVVDALSKDLKTSLQNSPHVKELKDHLQFVSLNFDLFCKALLKQDLYALRAIIPFFCLDLHLVNEQYLKHQFGKSHSHNLSTLCPESHYERDPELKEFLRDFSDAMLQMRYPVEKSAKFQNNALPEPLKWVLLLPNGDIKQLCTFVFNSYQQTLKHISGKDCDFNDLKSLLDESILKIQNKKMDAKPTSAVLKTRENLLQLGEQLLQKCAAEDRKAAQIALEEAVNHLITIDAVDYLQEHYGQLQYGALHHRNALSFQWTIEKIYAFFAITQGLGDLRYLSEDHLAANHDLTVFHAYTFPTNAPNPALVNFNLGRCLYYNRENPELFKAIRKTLKKIDPQDPEFVFGKLPENFAETMKKNRLELLNKGKELIEQLVSSNKK